MVKKQSIGVDDSLRDEKKTRKTRIIDNTRKREYKDTRDTKTEKV